MNDSGNEVVQERKTVDALSASDDPGRRRIDEGGLNLKPSGGLPAPTSLEQPSDGDKTAALLSVEDAVFRLREVTLPALHESYERHHHGRAAHRRHQAGRV